jgi:hypothetical protein
VVLQLWYIDVTLVLQWCYNVFALLLRCPPAVDSALALLPAAYGVTMMLKLGYSRVTVVLQSCSSYYSDEIVVSH